MQGEIQSDVTFFIIYNCKRYGSQKKFPDNLVVHSTLEQAIELADWISYWWPGQEGMWLVQGHEDD